MTNAEKYKTAKERTTAFAMFCKECSECPLQQKDTISCRFDWLELEAKMTAAEVADILAEYKSWRKRDRRLPSPCTWEEVNTAIDRAIEILRNVTE